MENPLVGLTLKVLRLAFKNFHNLWSTIGHRIALLFKELYLESHTKCLDLAFQWVIMRKKISLTNPPLASAQIENLMDQSYHISKSTTVSHREIDMDEAESNCQGDEMISIDQILLEKTWFGFDLDDTLHEFRKASGAASFTIFELISQTCDANIEELRATYSNILSQKTSSAFTEGKSSDTYRKERFSILMKAHSASFTDDTLDQLAAAYERSLESSLEAKPGAVSLLRYLKSIRKKIAIVTEGPEDAQKWTLEKLGITDYVDVLITSNRIGRTKVDGLFELMLKQLEIDARDVVYVGDSVKRDLAPARAEGIFSILCSEAEELALDGQELKIDSLRKLENILRL